ncbi:hypothetical protein NQ315_004354 [Exocentrus adspersus]|uniref:Gustatory receptor n=1 Tax=Exocentrus adspersus TaxID=1586481 RepID=A0AAV8W7L8_9CUCU|nr:hypothetical protein NQ315_004354 [Exocentrus adspersus]
MVVNFRKIAPAEKTAPSPGMCLCKCFNPGLTVCRLLGLFPATWTHENGSCLYKKSLLWTLYTFFVTSLYIIQICTSVDFIHLVEEKSLLLLLNNITEAIYGVYIVVLVYGLFCQPARRVVLRLQYAFIAVTIAAALLEISVLVWLDFSEDYNFDFHAKIFINRTMQSLSFVFYMLFFSIISVAIALLACFEKLTIKALKYVSVHPMKGIDETNNVRNFFGIIQYKLCTSEHYCTPKMNKLSSPELIEHLRILHEEISLCIYKINDCMNPQFLVHTGVELTVLIIHWYAVIAYLVYNFKSPFAKTLHVMNCSFVIQHTVGLFLFLKNAQHLKNMIEGLMIFLLEYSTRISTPAEHQQVRLFIEKVKHHRPFTASGVFTIDLGIAGPISANILTYVLVALQFEIPKE